MMKFLLASAAVLAMAGCASLPLLGRSDEDGAATNAARLEAALDAQPDEAKARYQYRHPKQTLEFFGVEPGMTVVDTLPGEIWYSGILAAYLGPEGKVIGADYSVPMWTLFGGFADEEYLAKRPGWAAGWVSKAADWPYEDAAEVGAMVYGSVPDELAGTVDVVLVVRAMHHFNRLEDEGGFRTQAFADINKVLKSGGVIGVVQHRAPMENSDQWAEGDNGYLKQDQVIAAFEAAGFEFVAASEINANAKDRPSEDEFVWRLPPILGTSKDDAALKAEMIAIGESDRMTLLFRKP
jgi:predicted methyltransferase